jgi:hypothetical protein
VFSSVQPTQRDTKTLRSKFHDVSVEKTTQNLLTAILCICSVYASVFYYAVQQALTATTLRKVSVFSAVRVVVSRKDVTSPLGCTNGRCTNGQPPGEESFRSSERGSLIA